VDLAILARHAESEFSSRGVVNGDPAVTGGALTATGRAQARELGRALEAEPIDLCVTSQFERVRETADIALEGRDVPRLVLPELNDIRFGSFEGTLLTDYRGWAWDHGPDDDCPGGGESRVAAARRFTKAFRKVLDRPERTILVVAHGLPIRYVLDAAGDSRPAQRAEPVDYAQPHRLRAVDLERAVERLEAWVADPVFV
jgi:2,3-bisphosphoglycerate-dependent phosphoglycerate mutase